MLAVAGGEEPLKRVRTIAAVNPAGDPVFAKLPAEGLHSEAQYRALWKIYVLSLVGNDLIWWYGQPMPDRLKQLDQLLRDVDLKSDDGAQNILTKLLARFKKGGPVKRLGIRIETNAHGNVLYVPEIEFYDHATDDPPDIVVPDAALELVDSALAEADAIAWVLFDRLDEAFRDHPAAELPALRALLRTYLDFKQYRRLRLKLFIRNDLFHRLVAVERFVALTHVAGRKRDIKWDTGDLEDLVYRRCRTNEGALREAGIDPADRQAVMRFFLPLAIDGAPAFTWIASRLEDGTGHPAPRNVIDLLREALANQSTADDRAPREQQPDTTLLKPESLVSAYTSLSSERLSDTVLAEADQPQRKVVEALRERSRVCTDAELCERTGLKKQEVTAATAELVEAGVLSKSNGRYSVPPLYVPVLRSID
jgi:hypothetical protein